MRGPSAEEAVGCRFGRLTPSQSPAERDFREVRVGCGLVPDRPPLHERPADEGLGLFAITTGGCRRRRVR